MNYESLLNRIYGAVADPALWPETLTSVAEQLDSIGGMVVYNAPPGGNNLIVLGRLDPEYTAIFQKHYVWNPWTTAVKDKPFNKAIIAGSLVERRIIKKTGFYADVLAPQHIEDMAVISHRGMARDGGVGGFGFSLSAEGVDRAEQHRRCRKRPSGRGGIIVQDRHGFPSNGQNRQTIRSSGTRAYSRKKSGQLLMAQSG